MTAAVGRSQLRRLAAPGMQRRCGATGALSAPPRVVSARQLAVLPCVSRSRGARAQRQRQRHQRAHLRNLKQVQDSPARLLAISGMPALSSSRVTET